MLASAWRHRQLLGTMIKREVVGRYRGSVMGLLWSLIMPVAMLLIYTFVFSVVFKARWTTGAESKAEFALIVFNLFSECINRAPGLILANVNYVKKVVFPLEILPWVSMGVALFYISASFLVWTLFYVAFYGWPHATFLLFPLVLLPLLIFVTGLSWLLASLGVFLRDVGQVIGFCTSALMLLSPIFYPVRALPEEYRPLLYLNPLTTVIEQARDVLFWGTVPNTGIWLTGLLVATATAWCGFEWFQKTRTGFANVL
jgi:lipopolysaccharide transport system permease protein